MNLGITNRMVSDTILKNRDTQNPIKEKLLLYLNM